MIVLYIEKKNFRNTTRYIFKVDYETKNDNDYEVITTVYYYKWDENNKKYAKFYNSRNAFAKCLCNKEFRCYAGKDVGEELQDVVEVIGYKQNDKYWIKTKPNETMTDNFSFLEYAKKHGFANKK